ncbi:hypothetical protein GRI39_02015 [Altererythrobacter indicus]|uniref:Uncharacterized protein n=1 Tax=Altericroceibacterium indicum TaxID=374177 RepID=A0A845A3J5_9SPHN|nr:gpW family head-tail joining protein [Altericroceibacterium indicum]MXP24822.1 hypothetical protein [Altericroceibacterium indicum]
MQRTTTEIAADLADYRAARSALVRGDRVEDISEDGSRVSFSKMSIKDIEASIESLRREYAQAEALEAGRPVRSAIGIYW